jgi:hypothetical protein
MSVKYYIIFIFILFACSGQGNKPVQEDLSLEQNRSSEPTPLPTVKAPSSVASGEDPDPITDSFYYDSITVDGLKFRTPIKTFLQKMGKPDSIVSPKYECGYFAEEGIPVKVYYYKGSSFHVYHDSAEINVIDFERKNDLIISNSKVALSNKTGLEDIKIYFPGSFEESYKENPGYNDNRLIRLYSDKYGFSRFYLNFFKNKLKSLEYWEPC